MRILLRADLDPFAGDALGLITALIKRGADVHLDPTHVAVPLPAEIAVLLTKPRAAGYDLILHHGTAADMGTDVDDDTLTVAWVYGTATPDKARLAGYDLLVGYDSDTTAALGAAGNHTPLATVNGGYTARDWTPRPRDWQGDDFAFAVIGEPNSGIVNAFTQLREQHPEVMKDVDLTVHTLEPTSDTRPGVTYVDGYFDADIWQDFYADHHVLITSRRSRDPHALQFLATGGTVIGTLAGGARQWLSSAVGYPVDWDMRSIDPDERDIFLDTILNVLQHRDDAARRGDTATRLIADMCGWDPVLDRLLLLLAEAVPGRGERLAHTARVAAERAKEKTRR